MSNQEGFNSFGVCPICDSNTFCTYDEWGHTPYHIHCSKCRINVGGPSPDKANQEFIALANFLKEYHHVKSMSYKEKHFFEYSITCKEVYK